MGSLSSPLRFVADGREERTDKCINIDQLPTDGKVAAILCVGGPVKCALKENSHVTHQFLMEFVCPGIAGKFGGDDQNRIASVLALPLLWVAHHPGLEHMLMDQVRTRIQQGHSLICQDHPADLNPVKKVTLVVHGVENILVIDALTVQQPDAGGDGGIAAGGINAAQVLTGQAEALQAVLNQVHLLRLSGLQGFVTQKFEQTNATVNWLRQATHFMPQEAQAQAQVEVAAPVIAAGQGNAAHGGRGRGGDGGQGRGGWGRGGIPAGRGVGSVQNNWVIRPNATLSPVPKNLHDIWQ
jgi:hypothetical protein